MTARVAWRGGGGGVRGCDLERRNVHVCAACVANACVRVSHCAGEAGGRVMSNENKHISDCVALQPSCGVPL